MPKPYLTISPSNRGPKYRPLLNPPPPPPNSDSDRSLLYPNDDDMSYSAVRRCLGWIIALMALILVLCLILLVPTMGWWNRATEAIDNV